MNLETCILFSRRIEVRCPTRFFLNKDAGECILRCISLCSLKLLLKTKVNTKILKCKNMSRLLRFYQF